MTLRIATLDDLAAIMDLEQRGFPTDAWSEQTMGTEICSLHNVYLVDIEGERVVGYGGVRALQGSADSDIQTIALDPSVRGQGRGRALLRALIATAVERGARELFLDVRDDNAVARALYASEGFVELGRRPGYYQPGDVDAVVMRLDLRSWADAASPETQENVRNAGADAATAPAIREKSGIPDAQDAANADAVDADAAKEASA
ncbi:ribosomal protein S18-alanine N-acetyltransferase [Microbacterium sp. NPDC089987]|uniref:ribosomal protein S18-alanine N-acetyltransferase n=1 Tax=Microbacterium sp. NPDC089987 TaxID=3364202 RepID=UPI003809C23D